MVNLALKGDAVSTFLVLPVRMDLIFEAHDSCPVEPEPMLAAAPTLQAHNDLGMSNSSFVDMYLEVPGDIQVTFAVVLAKSEVPRSSHKISAQNESDYHS